MTRNHRSLALTLVVALAVALGTLALAANSIDAAYSYSRGTYLIDGQGNALYLFLPDAAAGSTCTGTCAENWPPLAAADGGAIGASLESSLVATTTRADGSLQATYGGWPLYTFARDAGPADTNGQGLADKWYLVGTDGHPIGAPEGAVEAAMAAAAAATTATPTAADAKPEVAPVAVGDVMAAGERLYLEHTTPTCASCHSADGSGGAGPTLIGSSRVKSATRAVGQIVNGGHFMPPFGPQLTDAQLAALLTYVRNAWGNDFGPVTEEEVSGLR